MIKYYDVIYLKDELKRLRNRPDTDERLCRLPDGARNKNGVGQGV